MSDDRISNIELAKKWILTELRLRWLIKKLQDKKIISNAEFEEIWNSWNEEQGVKK